MDYSLPGSSVHGILQAKNTGVGCHSLLQGIFQTQGLNLGLLHCRKILYWEYSSESKTKPALRVHTVLAKEWQVERRHYLVLYCPPFKFSSMGH